MVMSGIGPLELLIILGTFLATFGIPIAVIVLLVMLVRRSNRPSLPPAGWGPDPRAVLGDRLARGEITLEEYDTAMRALGIPAAPRPGGPSGA